MTHRPTPGSRRRLFARGESLAIPVTPQRSRSGEKYEPRTADQTRVFLLPQLQNIVQTVHQMPSKLRSDSHLYIETLLSPNYLAASHFPTRLLNAIGATPVGSRAATGTYEYKDRIEETTTRRLILAIGDQGLDEFSRIISDGRTSHSTSRAYDEIKKLNDVALPNPKVLVGGDGISSVTAGTPIVWEAVLHPDPSSENGTQPIDQATLHKWYDLVDSLEGEVHEEYVRTVGGITFVPVTLSSESAAEAANFNPLRYIRPMPELRSQADTAQWNGGKVEPPEFSKARGPQLSIAIFDGGVDNAFETSVYFPDRAIDLTNELPDPDSLVHGTGVAGAAMYGLVRAGDKLSSPPGRIDNYRVFPAPPDLVNLHPYWMLDRIVQVVENGDYDLVNLSLGPLLPVDDASEPNRWTCELDRLAWEKDVLFVVAAGNCGTEDKESGKHRVQVPGDMVNGIAVGAYTTSRRDQKWRRATYSSMGPGRFGSRVQPLGLQFGGENPADPFPVLRPSGFLFPSQGTSYAAPLVTHSLAELACDLPEPNPCVLRAFAVHFAERPHQHKKLQDEVGYGRLQSSYSDVLECSADEVHVLYSDEISRGGIKGYRLPIPADIAGRLLLRLTLAYASPVDPTQPIDYTLASLDLTFRPHAYRFRLYPPEREDTDGEKACEVDIRDIDAISKMASGWSQSGDPVSLSLSPGRGKSETKLRESGKWETVRHYRKEIDSERIIEPRVDITYLARRAGALDSSPPSVRLALLFSVQSLAGDGTLYDRVAQEYKTLQAIETQVAIQIPT